MAEELQQERVKYADLERVHKALLAQQGGQGQGQEERVGKLLALISDLHADREALLTQQVTLQTKLFEQDETVAPLTKSVRGLRKTKRRLKEELVDLQRACQEEGATTHRENDKLQFELRELKMQNKRLWAKMGQHNRQPLTDGEMQRKMTEATEQAEIAEETLMTAKVAWFSSAGLLQSEKEDLELRLVAKTQALAEAIMSASEAHHRTATVQQRLDKAGRDKDRLGLSISRLEVSLAQRKVAHVDTMDGLNEAEMTVNTLTVRCKELKKEVQRLAEGGEGEQSHHALQRQNTELQQEVRRLQAKEDRGLSAGLLPPASFFDPAHLVRGQTH
jgi:chromosome segregation ATPase